MLSGEWEIARQSPDTEPYADLAAALRGDLVFANLETAIEAADGCIPKETRVFAAPETIEKTLESLGVELFSNAHGSLRGFGP